MVTFLASLLVWVLFGILAIYTFWFKKIQKGYFFKAVFTSIIAWSLSQMVKGIIPDAMRPFKVNGFPL
jgi:hypothetical protein